MMSNPLSDLWVNKYRPSTLEDLALSEDTRTFLEGYLAKGTIPHLLLAGPPGIGKTTLAEIVRDALDCQCLLLNSSKDRGIDVIRTKVATFAQGLFGSGINLVILDEFDGATPDAQNALRNLMETYSEHTRFILTANYPQKIIDPLRSRCHEIQMAELSVKDRFKVLTHVLMAEDVVYEPDTALQYSNRYTDLRRMLNAAQKAILTYGELAPPSEAGVSGALVMEKILSGDWDGIVAISKKSSVDHQLLLSDLFWAVPDDHDKAASMRFDIATALHESSFTPDQVVHTLGTIAGIMRYAK